MPSAKKKTTASRSSSHRIIIGKKGPPRGRPCFSGRSWGATAEGNAAAVCGADGSENSVSSLYSILPLEILAVVLEFLGIRDAVHVAHSSPELSAAIFDKKCKVFDKVFKFDNNVWLFFPPSTTGIEFEDYDIEQHGLEAMAARFPGLTSLTISQEYWEPGDDEQRLCFDDVLFPNLRSLSLSCAFVKSIVFTTANTPLLESLNLSNLIGDEITPFQLALPELTSFAAGRACCFL